MRRPAFFFAAVFCGILLDQLTKWLVFARLQPGESATAIPGVLQITRAQNRGVAFSMLRDHPILILAIAFVALAVITWLYMRSWRDGHPLFLTALGLLLIGAVGNVIDRMLFGYVRDFIDFVPELPVVGRWAVFNIADICITIGVGCFLIAEFFLKPAPKPDLNTETQSH